MVKIRVAEEEYWPWLTLDPDVPGRFRFGREVEVTQEQSEKARELQGARDEAVRVFEEYLREVGYDDRSY